jgi:hypothetical protein
MSLMKMHDKPLDSLALRISNNFQIFPNFFNFCFEFRGATCYLNALVQTLYMTPPFRNGLYQLTAEDLGHKLVTFEFV